MDKLQKTKEEKTYTKEEVIRLLYSFGEEMENREHIDNYYRYDDWININLQ